MATAKSKKRPATTGKRKVKPGPRRDRSGGRIPDNQIVPGSSTARRRAKEREQLIKKTDTLKRPPPFRIGVAKLEEICRTGLPGYDPWRDAHTNGFHFDHSKAKAAIGFFHCELRHSRGAKARHPFKLETWQKAFIGNLFGWVDRDGWRRYREALVYIPRKNGKTPLAAGIIMIGLLVDNEPGAEIYGCAATFEQASLVFNQCEGYLEYNERLADRCKVFGGYSYKAIKLEDHPDNPDRFGFYRPIAADSRLGHGLTPSMVVIDELHLQPNRDLVDSMITSLASEGRRQPLIIYITTADYGRPSICNEKLEYANKIRESSTRPPRANPIINDPRYLPAIWGASREDDWQSEKVWRAANPNLGVSVSLDHLRREAQRAVDEPSYENSFKRLHLNITTEQDKRWLRLDLWDACDGSTDGLEGQRCFAGLDLASTRDTTAFVLVFPQDDGSIDIVPHFWLPSADAVRREKRDRVPYQSFADRGELYFAGETETDYTAVSAKIAECYERYNVVELAYDRYNAQAVTSALKALGLRNLIEYNQGFVGMNAPARELERLISAGKVRHGGHGLLRYQASAVAIMEQPGTGYIMPSKNKSTDRIDGIVAILMALGRAMVAPKKQSMRPVEWL